MFAVCLLEENQKSGVSGIVRFYQESESKPTLIFAKIKGLSKGNHGIHVHQFGNLSKGCQTAGPHFNPFNAPHGGPKDIQRHVGDLGNILSEGKDTESILRYEDRLVNLFSNSIIGRSVVVHANEDDLGKGKFEDSKTTGHSGDRLACGVIGISQEFELEIPFWEKVKKDFSCCWKR